MTSADVSAQSTTRWVGSDYNDAVGQTVFLYNVGTGRFMVHGGDWGTQARVFDADNGKSMTPTLNNGRYVLKTGVNTGEAAVLGANIPTVTSDKDWKSNSDSETWNIIMDAHEEINEGSSKNENRDWKFIRVGEGDGTYTYYMYEELGGGTTTNFYYITFTSGSTTYYLTVTNNSTVGVTTDRSQAQRWTTASTYYISYTTSNGTTYYLKNNSGTPVVASGSNGNTANLYSNSSPYIVYEGGSYYNPTYYYLKYNNDGSLSFATGTNGNLFQRSSQQSETTGGT